MIPVTCFASQTVGVFGLGKSGLSAVDGLVEGGARVFAWDDNEPARAALASRDVDIADLHSLDFSGLDALVLAPGVPLTHPEPHWIVQKATGAGVEIIGDTELFVRELAARDTGAKLVAITGTNGKSTTTALLGHVLAQAGRDAGIGGNIGTAVLSLEPPGPDTVYVIEFSSFQIDLTPSLRPDVAILLNITADHLDRHGDIDHYAAVKARIFAQQRAGDSAVVALDDDLCVEIAHGLPPQAQRIEISGDHAVDNGYFATGGQLFEARGGKPAVFTDLSGIGSLRGSHNGQNAAAATAAALALGLSPEDVVAGLQSFPGLSHRMEQVGVLDGVVFINDSKATNVDAARRALASFDRVLWIAGGLAKSGGIENLKEFFPKIEKAYLIGDAAQVFADTMDGEVDCEIAGTVERAVAAAARDLGRGDVSAGAVVFSPACASFDQYRNFELRGDAFRQAVHALDGVTKSKGT